MQNSRETHDLEKLIARLHSQTPLIGWELRRMAVNALAKNGSPEAMDALADVFSHSADQRVHQMALEVLQNLAAEGNAGAQEALCRLMVAHQHPLAREIVLAAQYAPHDPKQRARFVNTLTEILIHSADSKVHRSIIRILTKIAEEGRLEAQEALCRLVIEYHHPLAREIVLAAQYAPRDPLQRALLYILTAQWDKYEQLDFDHHLLRTAYNAVDKKLQKRIVVSARQGGRADLLASFVAGEQHVDRMTDEDWQAMLAALSKHGEWAELWRLAQTAPVIWSMRLLLRLKETNWMPEQATERTEFTNLVRLAEECSPKADDPQSWLVYCHTALEGHTASVSCLAISPDGQLLASGGIDRAVRLWVLRQVDVSRLIVEQISLKELHLVQERLQDDEVADAERKWLEFILALARWQRRFDVEIGEVPHEIPVGEFDIEI